jgi:hypothetical protein
MRANSNWRVYRLLAMEKILECDDPARTSITQVFYPNIKFIVES